jgi:predicted PurR-regulated permease PerM
MVRSKPVATPSEKPHSGIETICLVVLTVIASTVALYFGREFFVPIAFAVMLNALLRPVVKFLISTLRVPTPAAAGIVTVTAMLGIGLVVYEMSGPVHNWLVNAPASLTTAQTKLERLRRPVQQMTEVANRIEHTADGSSTTAPSTAPVAAAPKAPEWAARMFGTTTRLFSGVVGVLLMLYLLLAAGDLFVRKLIKVMPSARDKEAAARVVDESQSVIMRYILVTAMINASQGFIVGVAMWLLGMPSPIMWALLTFVFEFVPYLGAVVMIILLMLVAFSTFDPLWRILAVPATYLVISTIQNSIVSPIAYGNRLRLNPVAVLIGVLFWWFLWGVPGAFLAVPIIAMIKVIADRTQVAKALGEFLGE